MRLKADYFAESSCLQFISQSSSVKHSLVGSLSLTCDVQRCIPTGGLSCTAPGHTGVDPLMRLTPPAPASDAEEEQAPLW